VLGFTLPAPQCGNGLCEQLSYCEPIRATGPVAFVNPFRFSTKYCDDETGHYYYGYRYYSPTQGRWLSRDPIGENGGRNLYGFLDNDPANYVDVLGKWKWYNPYSWIYDPDEYVYHPPLPLKRNEAGGEPAASSYDKDSNLALRNQEGVGLDNRFVNPNNPQESYTAAELIGKKIPCDLAANFIDAGTMIIGGGTAKTAATAGGKSSLWKRIVSCFKKEKCAERTVLHLHHPLPKFLGGDANQLLSKLDPNIHQEFHQILRQNLKDAGIPLNVGGRGGSAADWAEYMQLNPGAQRAAFDSVLNASRVIDKKYGTQITQDVWMNVMQGNFTPFP